jgi:hypothetical protein
MENLGTKLSELQFTILDGMADDYEDLEQLYLHANREFSDEEQANIQFPRIRFHRDLQEMVPERVPSSAPIASFPRNSSKGSIETCETARR